MTMVANSTSLLQAEKLKLKARVKHLCSENNRLRELAHSQCNGEKVKMDSNSFTDIDTQGEEIKDGEKIKMHGGV